MPHGLKFVVDVEAQRRVVGPHHFRVVVLFVARHQQLALAFQLVDGVFGAGPAVAQGAHVEALRRGLRLQVAEELGGGADVVDGAEGEGAEAVGAGAVEGDFFVVLEDGADGAFVVVFAVLEGEVGEQVLEGLRRALGFEVVDGVGDLCHDVFASAGVGGLGVDDVGLLRAFALELILSGGGGVGWSG